MGQWQELNDFSAYSKRVPCPLDKGDAEPTLVGDHFKCGTCSHIFNEDGSKLEVDCYCDACQPSHIPDLPECHEIKSEKKVAKKKKENKQ